MSNKFDQILAWSFLVLVFCLESWRLVFKYCELFILTDPFQDKTETLTTCYEELYFTCDRLLLQPTPAPGCLDTHLHILSFERLEDIHLRVLQSQHAWLVEKCLCHEVPSAKALLLMAKRQARLLREHDACKHQLQTLLTTMRRAAAIIEKEKGEEKKVVGSEHLAAASTLILAHPTVSTAGHWDRVSHKSRRRR